MKILAILLVVLCHNSNISCYPILDFLMTALTEVASSFANSLNLWKNRIKSLITSRNGEDITNKNSSSSDLVQKIPLKYVNKRKMLESSNKLSTPQLIIKHGRKCRSHVVLTEDGYLLTLHQILPNGRAAVNMYNKANGTVLLHHGLLGSSADWILLGRKKSLPYLLSDIGYDVWMTNARGSTYSRKHISLKVNSTEFWKFSWQEIGEYDLPAVIDYIRRRKNSSEPINYIGHSMGATALLVLLSTKLQYNQYLRIGILLAPLAFMDNVHGPLKHLATMAFNPSSMIMELIGNDEFISSRIMPNILVEKYCKGSKIFCSNPLFFISGGIRENGTWETGFLKRLLQHVPAGGSTNTILHYAQVASNKTFHKFNNTLSEFPLSQITLPIALFSSDGDWLAAIPDVLKLYSVIGHPLDHYIVSNKNLSHAEFVWGRDANQIIFKKVMYVLDKGLHLSFLKRKSMIV